MLAWCINIESDFAIKAPIIVKYIAEAILFSIKFRRISFEKGVPVYHELISCPSLASLRTNLLDQHRMVGFFHGVV